MKNLIKDDRLDDFKDIFSDYSISIETIESILKIDKINDAKNSLPTSVKKSIMGIISQNNNADEIKSNNKQKKTKKQIIKKNINANKNVTN